MALSLSVPLGCRGPWRVVLATIFVVCQMPAASLAHAQSSSSDTGEWSSPITLGFVPVHTHVLPSGKVLTWQRHDYPGGDTKTRVWNPADGSYTEHEIPHIDGVPHNDIFCSGHSMLPDGRLLVTGGHDGHSGPDGYFGTKYANIFDYLTAKWSRVADMNAPRWYPSSCVLSDGEMLVLSGEASGENDRNVVPQVWKTNAGEGWRTLSSTEPAMPLYPWLHLAPNGKVFNAGPNRNTGYIDASGEGAWTAVADTKQGDRGPYTGASVVYDHGKILVLGGDQPRTFEGHYPSATNSAEVIDLNAASPTWRTVSPMKYARRHVNATVLPDGKVLVTGGTAKEGAQGTEADSTGGDDGIAVKPAELWDPATEQWTELASLAVPRLYHSSAVLLPDGRVFSGGGGQAVKSPDGEKRTHKDVELFSPPYLFRGSRPTIATVPAKVGYSETFTLQTPEASSIKDVTLIRLPSVTHSFNQNQGFNRLSFSRAEGSCG